MSELASLADRLKGALVDTILFAIPYYLLKTEPGGIAGQLAGAAILLVLLVVHVWLLASSGQTIGKRVAGTRIVSVKTGEHPGFLRAVVLRYVVNGLLGRIPYYWLLDVLPIFRGDRRCIHDWLAGTRVVRLPASGERT